MFDDIAINFWFSWNFASKKDMIQICNLTIRFSKFTLKLKDTVYEKFKIFFSKLVWREPLSLSLSLSLWNVYCFLFPFFWPQNPVIVYVVVLFFVNQQARVDWILLYRLRITRFHCFNKNDIIFQRVGGK